MAEFQLHTGDALTVLKGLESESVQSCITSPPYFNLRDYQVENQLGLEASPELYVERLVLIFREVRRVLRKDGTCWLNLGDSYAGSGKGGQSEDKRSVNWQPKYGNKGAAYGLKPKDLIGIPWMVAFALRSDGWYLRSDIIWNKPNPMPESVTDRPTKAHEYIFLLTKSAKYYYDAKAVAEPSTGRDPGNKTHKYEEAYNNGAKEHRTKVGLVAYSFKRKTATTPPPGQPTQHREDRDEVFYNTETRNRRSVWTVATQPFPEAHFAVFPPELIKPCILAGSKENDSILDPFAGAGTTGLVSLRHGRDFVGIELNPEYVQMARRRLINDAPLLNQERVA